VLVDAMMDGIVARFAPLEKEQAARGVFPR
jgi:hypothetical protein